MDIKILAMAVSAALLLSACGSDGDDGKDGVDGTAGTNGTNGTNGVDGTDGTDGVDGTDGADGDDATAPALTRLATVPEGAELTGMFKTDNGEVFFNVQHPATSLPGDESKAAVGAWIGTDLDNLDPYLDDLSVPVAGSDDAQTTRVAVGSYQVLGRAGDTFTGSLPFGLGNIVTADGTASIKQSPNPDFNAFVPSNADGSEGFLFTAWEDRPGAVSRIALTKSDSGWTTGAAMNVNFADVNGTMINCFGTVSPWGTPLTSEENYESENAANWNNSSYTNGYPSYSDVQNIQTYLGSSTLPNPYDYGYIVEITEPTADEPGAVKHFTMGRLAHENAVIMPDQKTVYLTSDGSDQGFYKFVADTAGDLSSGTLYVAKVTQDATSDNSKAGFDISWMEMGHSDNTTIETYIDSFDGIDEADYVEGETSYIDDATIAAHVAGTTTIEALPFVETNRVAAAMGATTEFNKMEGININYDGVASGAIPFMYVAMAEVRNGMADTEGDIQVEENRCGIVYRFGLDSTYDVARMEPVVIGGTYDSTSTTDRCDVNAIAQPDNVMILDDGRVLIGEDSSNHNNNMMWVYNPNGQ